MFDPKNIKTGTEKKKRRNIKMMEKHLRKTRKMRRKILSLLLAVTLTVTGMNFQMMSESIYAAKETSGQQKKQKVQKKAEAVRELPGERTENSSTYLMSDGTKKLEVYGENIRYKEKGKWKDYDSTLKELTVSDKNRLEKINESAKIKITEEADGYKYVNSRGDSYQYFAEKFDEGHPIVMNKNGHTIRFAPALKTEGTGAATVRNTEEKAGAEALKKTYSK